MAINRAERQALQVPTCCIMAHGKWIGRWSCRSAPKQYGSHPPAPAEFWVQAGIAAVRACSVARAASPRFFVDRIAYNTAHVGLTLWSHRNSASSLPRVTIISSLSWFHPLIPEVVYDPGRKSLRSCINFDPTGWAMYRCAKEQVSHIAGLPV